MTDISFNDVKYMKKLWKEFGSEFIWCDHHAPIIKSSFELKFDDVSGIRDTNRSAILCAYKYLYDPFDDDYNHKKVPELLRILSAWDSWTYDKEGYDFEFVRRVNKAVTYKYNLELSKIKELVSDLITVYKNNEPFCLIECQGQQHYHSVEYFGGEESFKKQQIHDKLKRDYAEMLEIPLIEIEYTLNKYADIKRILEENEV